MNCGGCFLTCCDFQRLLVKKTRRGRATSVTTGNSHFTLASHVLPWVWWRGARMHVAAVGRPDSHDGYDTMTVHGGTEVPEYLTPDPMTANLCVHVALAAQISALEF